MKVIHQKIEAYPDRIRLPVDYLKISDPYYEKGVWCRYEKDNIQMDSIQVLVKHETIYDEQVDQTFDYGELVVSLSNKYCQGKPTEEKDYQIGVDTARYVFETEHNLSDIYTAADGVFGGVNECYYGDNLGKIDIYLAIPDECAMSEKEFISSVLRTMSIYHLHLRVIRDEDVDIDISDEEPSEQLQMSP